MSIISLPIPDIKQPNSYSCSYAAALSVVKYLSPHPVRVTKKQVWEVVAPSRESGCDCKKLVKALASLGIHAEYWSDLDLKFLRIAIQTNRPIIVTVKPADYKCDHWTVVRAISKDRIWLTNYKDIALEQFEKEWYDYGEGLVCSLL